MVILYVKTHNVTGLKYFGKTTKEDINTYLGSGKYWRRHIKKYGTDITTNIIAKFQDEEECEKFAIQFSKKNDIIKSKEWANLILENGKTGAPKGNILTNLTKTKISKSLLGKPNPKSKYIMHESSETRSKRSRKITKNSFWITNDIEDRRIKGNIPQGWKLGRSVGKWQGNINFNSHGNNTRGKKLYNNGIKHAYFVENEQPENWKRGKFSGFGYRGGR